MLLGIAVIQTNSAIYARPTNAKPAAPGTTIGDVPPVIRSADDALCPATD
jgi:hypothetical protein